MFLKEEGMRIFSKSIAGKILCLAVACVWSVLAVAATAATPAKPKQVDERAVQALNVLNKRFQAVQTAHGKFDQIKRSEVFGQESRTRGEFWYAKPDKFRCEYSGKRDADELINLIVNNVAYVATPKLKQVERYPFDNAQATQRQLDRILLGFGLATEEILKSYTVTLVKEDRERQEVWLRFVPTFEDNYGVDAIVVRMDMKNARPIDLVIEEGEDRTTLIIRDLELNEKIDSKRFKVDFPDSWEIIDELR